MTPAQHVMQFALDQDARTTLLPVVRELVARANGGGGIATFPNVPLSPELLLAHLLPVDLERLIQPFVGPSTVHIRNITPLAGEVAVFVAAAEPYPLVLMDESVPTDDGSGYFASGDILVRRDGRATRARYPDVVEMLQTTAGKLYRPDSAATLLDVTLARRARNSSALLDRMDLLWCLAERSAIELTAPRLDLLLRSSLRRPPTLFFWLTEFRDRSAVEEVLVSSLADEARDTSDAKNAVLEVAALVASDSCLNEILEKMSTSEYSHFREAAVEWQGRRAVALAFEDRALSLVIDDMPAIDVPLPALYGIAEEAARRELEGGVAFRRLGDIGRVIYSSRPHEPS